MIGANKNLTWRHLKALNDLYRNGITKAKIMDHSYIDHLVRNKKYIRFRTGNHNILEAQSTYRAFYESQFKENFSHYESFLQATGLETDARRRYDEEDIKTLMFIHENKEYLKNNLTTIRTFSSEMFKNRGSKYLENHPGLMIAVCKILGITNFPDRDPQNLQWRFVVDCLDSQAIILCENLAHLKNPWRARKLKVELWYVGGNNIGNVDHISIEKLNKPIYYSCDWDFHGLSIYSRIKEKLRSKLTEIILLFPVNQENTLPIDSPYHNSRWNNDKYLSGLKSEDFTEKEKFLIDQLIKENKWIEEESNDIFMLFK